MADRLVLVGMMGAGKTTVGRAVADRLGWAFVDTDAEVEAAAGSSVAELFAGAGEPAFREAERRALATALSDGGPVVVSAGGGAVVDEGNRHLLSRSATVVWLRADPATLAARVGDGAGRPLLAGDAAGALAALDAGRRPLYAAVADAVVDVDDLDVDAVVGRALAARTGAGVGP